MIVVTTITVNAQNAPSWCIAKTGAIDKALEDGLNWACSPSGGAVDCSAIQSGGVCYEPNTLSDHASYAYNQYYQKQHQTPAACDFSGSAVVTSNNPS